MTILKHRIRQTQTKLNDEAARIIAFDALREHLPKEVTDNFLIDIFAAGTIQTQLEMMDAVYLLHAEKNRLTAPDQVDELRLNPPTTSTYLSILDEKLKLVEAKQKALALEARTCEGREPLSVPVKSSLCPCAEVMARRSLQGTLTFNQPAQVSYRNYDQNFNRNFNRNFQQRNYPAQGYQQNYQQNFQQQNFQRPFQNTRNALPFR